MKDVFFSIIIPTYNREKLIVKTIDSALNQSFKDYELIIVDDASTDNTEKVLRTYIQSNTNILYVKQEKNLERSAARNKGVKYAKGKYIYFLDSDDLIKPDHLKEAFNFINEKINPPIFFQPYEIYDQSRGKIKFIPKIKYNLNHHLVTQGNIMSCHGVFLKKEVAIKYPFREDMNLSEDYELWLRIASEFEIKFNDVCTSSLIIHKQRSVNSFFSGHIIESQIKFIESLKNNPSFMKKYKKYFNSIKSNSFSYIALHLLINKDNKILALRYFIKSLSLDLSSLLRKRTLVIMKKLVF